MRAHRGCDRANRKFAQRQNSRCKTRRLLVLPDWVAQHVTGGVGGYQFPTQFIQWGAIVVSDRYDVALSPAHAWDFFVKYDGLAIPDARTEPLQSVTIDCPSRALKQMGRQLNAQRDM